MRSRRILATSLVVVLAVSPFAFAAQGPPIVASSICAAPGVNPRVTTHLPAPLKSPRVYFRAGDNGPEYYVDMHQGSGDAWWIVLPAVDTFTRSITYRVVAQDANNNWVNGTPVKINVSASCPATEGTSQDTMAADNIVLGLTTSDESAVPVGFSCKGIKTVIAANGQMRPAEECRMALAKLGAAPVTGAAGTMATTAGGVSTALIAALVVGGGLVGYAIYHNNQKNNNNVSSSRP